jgi:hypothetical protein
LKIIPALRDGRRGVKRIPRVAPWAILVLSLREMPYVVCHIWRTIPP